MAGRKPKPTVIKQLEGNPGKRPLNLREPKLPAEIPPCPKHLTGEARKEWRRTSKQLAQAGLITKVDRAALAAYCQNWARWIEAEEAMRADDHQMIVYTDKGYPVVSPWLGIAERAMKQMRTFLTEFGMTPSSRSRLTGPDRDAAVGLNELLDEVAARDGS